MSQAGQCISYSYQNYSEGNQLRKSYPVECNNQIGGVRLVKQTPGPMGKQSAYRHVDCAYSQAAESIEFLTDRQCAFQLHISFHQDLTIGQLLVSDKLRPIKAKKHGFLIDIRLELRI